MYNPFYEEEILSCDDQDIHDNTDKIYTDNIIEGIDQGSDEWFALRLGCITGSKIGDMMAKGDGLTRNKFRNQLAAEIITGSPMTISFKSKAMIKGNDDEPIARDHYEFVNDAVLRQVTFVKHPHIPNAGASPDSLVGNDGLLEIKCPNMDTHIGYLVERKIPRNYLFQMHWQMACTGRAWCDWMSYCKELPLHIRSLVIRVTRDEQIIRDLEKMATAFNEEVDQLIINLGLLQ